MLLLLLLLLIIIGYIFESVLIEALRLMRICFKRNPYREYKFIKNERKTKQLKPRGCSNLQLEPNLQEPERKYLQTTISIIKFQLLIFQN